MRFAHPKDFLTGLMFLLFGGAAMVLSRGLTIGRAAKMGPGYFPFALGLLLAVLGAVILSRSLLRTEEPPSWPSFHFGPLAIVLLSVFLFSQLLRPFGLLLSTVLLVVMVSKASHEFRWRETLVNAAALVVIVLVVFVYFLKFQIPVWPAFIAGG
jgi:putative tricarboxylic transport membrane protein